MAEPRSSWTTTPRTTPTPPTRAASAGLTCMVTGCPDRIGTASVSGALRSAREEEDGDADPPDVPEQAEPVVRERGPDQGGRTDHDAAPADPAVHQPVQHGGDTQGNGHRTLDHHLELVAVVADVVDHGDGVDVGTVLHAVQSRCSRSEADRERRRDEHDPQGQEGLGAQACSLGSATEDPGDDDDGRGQCQERHRLDVAGGEDAREVGAAIGVLELRERSAVGHQDLLGDGPEQHHHVREGQASADAPPEGGAGRFGRGFRVDRCGRRTHVAPSCAALGTTTMGQRDRRRIRRLPGRAGRFSRLRARAFPVTVPDTGGTHDSRRYEMRAIWKGAVSFGLVSVPVKLYAATESHDVSFRQVHAKDGGRIKYQRVCSIDGEEVEYADIAKGYETEDGEMVILTDDDMAALPSTSSREISVEKFVPSNQIDPMLLEKSYYLEPEKTGAKPYALLRQALLDADRMAVVTVALRQRTTVGVLRVKDDVIVLQTMMWPDEVRNPDFSVETGDVKRAEVKMANMLVETLAGDFEPSEFEDDYAEAVEEMVKAKIEGGEVKKTPTSIKSSGEVVDLLAALQRSVDAAKTARGETTSADDQESKPAKKTTAKKATKKTTAKKAAKKKAS